MVVSCVFYVCYYSSYAYSGLNVSIVKSLASQNYLSLCSEYSIITFIAMNFSREFFLISHWYSVLKLLMLPQTG